MDVVEVDTVFLRDLVDGHLIQELPAGTFQPGDFLPVARKACVLDDKSYGVPHWVCGNFLFFRSDDPDAAKFKSVTNLAGLERLLGRPLSWSESLLLSLNGKSTLGEEYLDAVFDTYGDPDETLRHIDPKAPDIEAVRAIIPSDAGARGPVSAAQYGFILPQTIGAFFYRRKNRNGRHFPLNVPGRA